MEDRYRDYGPVMLFRYGRTFKVQLNSMRTDDLSLLQKQYGVHLPKIGKFSGLPHETSQL